jgi:hypothetical protein
LIRWSKAEYVTMDLWRPLSIFFLIESQSKGRMNKTRWKKNRLCWIVKIFISTISNLFFTVTCTLSFERLKYWTYSPCHHQFLLQRIPRKFCTLLVRIMFLYLDVIQIWILMNFFLILNKITVINLQHSFAKSSTQWPREGPKMGGM